MTDEPDEAAQSARQDARIQDADWRMTCPICFRFGAPRARIRGGMRIDGTPVEYDAPIVPDPACRYCGGRGWVPVTVRNLSSTPAPPSEQVKSLSLFDQDESAPTT